MNSSTPGLCECGCGGLTNIAKKTQRDRGVVAGEPRRFIAGHHLPPASVTYIVTDNGCWEWDGFRDAKGYGRIRRNGRSRPAHQWFYEQANGPIPLGAELDHLCRNRACVNPAHLEPVAHAENVRRGAARKLTDKDLEAIRASTQTHAAVAAQFGLSRSYVAKLRRRSRVGMA